MSFQLLSTFSPQGDQPQAISQLLDGYQNQSKLEQTLLGVTGSGKTFTMANVIAALGKKTLVLAPNKTLAAQLYAEFKEFFPNNAVEYFVSYYDYYQPEAYVPGTDTFIEKDSAINDEIDKLRHSTTRSLFERDDVIVVASVSCIYGIGSPSDYFGQKMTLFEGQEWQRDDFLRRLIAIQYKRNDYEFSRGHFRVRGDLVEVFPAYEDSNVVRLEFFEDVLETIQVVNPFGGEIIQELPRVVIYPSSHYVVEAGRMKQAIKAIRFELKNRVAEFENEKKFIEAQRISQRTNLDLEMMKEMGFCPGIENYSRHLTGANPGDPPPTLLDYFKKDFLLIIDESHLTVSQVGGMYNGDRARKLTLVDYGFRLPSALDNRPLNFKEFCGKLDQVLYVSATPADYELQQTQGEFVEQIIRPTGLLDPEIELRPAGSQVDDLFVEVKKVINKGDRVLITTLTKKLSEKLTEYYSNAGLKVKYLHSDISSLERIEIIRDLRLGKFDILVGINLLREGLDIPEVSLVAILDADKEGFLRSERSLIQTIGRAARNSEGRVILYCYEETESIKKARAVTEERRIKQMAYNKVHGLIPMTIKKNVSGGVIEVLRGKKEDFHRKKARLEKNLGELDSGKIEKRIKELKLLMKEASRNLEFEAAAKMRDEIKQLTDMRMAI